MPLRGLAPMMERGLRPRRDQIAFRRFANIPAEDDRSALSTRSVGQTPRHGSASELDHPLVWRKSEALQIGAIFAGDRREGWVSLSRPASRFSPCKARRELAS